MSSWTSCKGSESLWTCTRSTSRHKVALSPWSSGIKSLVIVVNVVIETKRLPPYSSRFRWPPLLLLSPLFAVGDRNISRVTKIKCFFNYWSYKNFDELGKTVRNFVPRVDLFSEAKPRKICNPRTIIENSFPYEAKVLYDLEFYFTKNVPPGFEKKTVQKLCTGRDFSWNKK